MTKRDWDGFQVAPVLVGVLFSTVVGILAIAGLKWIVSNDKLHYFGYYCLVVGAVVILVALIEKLTGCGGSSENAAEMLAMITPTDIASGADAVSAADIAAALIG